MGVMMGPKEILMKTPFCNMLRSRRQYIVLILCLFIIVVQWNQLSQLIISAPWNMRRIESVEVKHKWTGSPYLTPSFKVEPKGSDYSTASFVTFVLSSYSNIEKRKNIRHIFTELFLNTSNGRSKLFFVIGDPTDQHSDDDIRKVKDEIDVYGDVLQVNLQDSTENLSHKSIFALYWTLENCKRVKLTARINDDYDSIEKEMFRTMTYSQELQLSGVILCGELKRFMFVIGINYENESFPAYCDGRKGTYITTDVIRMILETAKEKDTFAIEDIYVSGLLRLEKGVQIAEIIMN